MLFRSIINIKKHPDAEKLYIEEIDLGNEKRQIVSGLVPYYSAEELLNKKIVVVTNLEPAKLRGVESNGMLLAAQNGNGVDAIVDLLSPNGEIGDYIFLEGMNQEDIDTTKNLQKINIKEFSEYKLEVKDKSAYCNGILLKTVAGNVTTEKVSDGVVR